MMTMRKENIYMSKSPTQLVLSNEPSLRNLPNVSNRSSPMGSSRLTSSQPHLNLLKTEENLRSRSAVQGKITKNSPYLRNRHFYPINGRGNSRRPLN